MCARLRKQILHKPNLRSTDRARPHLRQRVYPRTLNFGSFCCLFTRAFFAMYPLILAQACGTENRELQEALDRDRPGWQMYK